MFAHLRMRARAPCGRHCASPSSKIVRIGAAAIAVALVAACSASPVPPVAHRHPADPAAPSRPVAYRSVVVGSPMRPADASGWRTSNDRVAPGEKP
jgi:hypothetical protein